MSERDQIRGRARKAFPRKYPDADAVVDAMTDFAAQERDRAWNEALTEAHYSVWHTADACGVTPETRESILRALHLLKRPQPPAQQDDKPEIEWRTGSEWEDVDGADGSKPIDPSASPAPFDVERRLRALEEESYRTEFVSSVERERWISRSLAREAHAAGAREKAEEIAQECLREQDVVSGGTYNQACAVCAEIARSHAIPPQPAPETREERYRKALEMILKEPALGISQARFAAREALGGGA